MLNTATESNDQIKTKILQLKYFFNAFDEESFFEYITESFNSFLENENDKENGKNFTFLRDARATKDTIRDGIVIQTTWLKSKENEPSVFCFSPDYNKKDEENAKSNITVQLAQAISEKYRISYNNALLIVKFRGQHLHHNCLIGQGVNLLQGAESQFYRNYFSEPNSLSCIDFYRENQDGNLIYQSFLISLSNLNTQEDIDELIQRLKNGKAINANDPHVISQQSFKMTYREGQEIPELSDYQRFDTSLFDERRKKLTDYSDCYNPQFKQYLENICRRPVSLPSDRQQTIQTFTDLLTDRLNNIESPAELINIFKDFPPDADLLTHTTNIQDALVLKDETLKRKYITKNLTEILDKIVPKITHVQLDNIKKNLNKYCENKLNGFNAEDVKNAILFSYFYHIVIQNIIKACPTINGHEKNKLYSAAKDIFNKKIIMSSDLSTVEYLKKAASCIVPTEDENCVTFAASAKVNKLNITSGNFFNDLNRIFNYFPAQKDFTSELEQFNKIIEKANEGNSLSEEDESRLQLDVDSYLKGKKSALPIYWQKTIIEVGNFIIQMQMHAKNNFLDIFGNIRQDIKTVLETTYGCDIDSWIKKHGKDKVYNALFNSYFSNIYTIEFKAALNKNCSKDENDNKFRLVQWIFNKLSGEDYTDITRPVPYLQELSKSTTKMINDEFKSGTNELETLNQDFTNNLNRIKASEAGQQNAYKKALLNYSVSLYQAQLSWQNQNQEAKEGKYDFIIESVQQQQGHIQNLLFLTEQPRVINDLVSVLNLTQELPLFSNAESVIDMAKINIQQKKADMISEIEKIGEGMAVANHIKTMFDINGMNSSLRKIWSATKEEKPSLFMACFNSAMRGLGIYDKDVNGLAEREYLTEVKKKIKGFLINSEFEQSIINVIEHFQAGKISQNEVVPAIKLIIKHYEPHLLGRIERLNAFCDSFSSLIKEHKKLYEVKEVPILENAVEEEPTIQPNQKPDPDAEMSKLRETSWKNIEAINKKHCYSSRFWREPGFLMDAPVKINVADMPAKIPKLI